MKGARRCSWEGEKNRNKGWILNEGGASGVIYRLQLLVRIGVGAAMGT